MEDNKLDAQLKKYIISDNRNMPFSKFIGMDNITSVARGEVKVELEVRHDHLNIHGIAHGGVLMAMADTAMWAACSSVNKKVVTLDFNMNMMRAVPENLTIHAVGKILHNGARTLVVECDIVDKAEKIYARARATFFVMGKCIEE